MQKKITILMFTVLILLLGLTSCCGDKVDKQAVIEHHKASIYFNTETYGKDSLENFELSLKHYKKVIGIDPNYPDPHLYTIVFYLYETIGIIKNDNNKYFKEAIKYFKNIEKQTPNNTELILVIARTYSYLNDKEKTEKYLSKITNVDPFYIDIYPEAVYVSRKINNKVEENRFLILAAKAGNKYYQKQCDELGLKWRDE